MTFSFSAVFGTRNHDMVARLIGTQIREETMEMTRTLIGPGLDGAPAPHWQHWWAVTDPRALRVDLNDPAVCDRAPSHEARA